MCEKDRSIGDNTLHGIMTCTSKTRRESSTEHLARNRLGASVMGVQKDFAAIAIKSRRQQPERGDNFQNCLYTSEPWY